MSQLRVTSLLASRKSGVEVRETGKPSLVATRAAKNAVEGTSATLVESLVSVSDQSTLEQASNKQKATTTRTIEPTTPTNQTRLTRSRSGSIRAEHAGEEGAASSSVRTPAAKRKTTSAVSTKEGSQAKKQKLTTTETQTDSTLMDTDAPVAPSASADSTAAPAVVTVAPSAAAAPVGPSPMVDISTVDDVLPRPLSSDLNSHGTDLSLDLPFALPPLEPIPMQPTRTNTAITNQTSRGSSLHARARANAQAATMVVRPNLLEQRAREREQEAAAAAAAAQAQAAAAVRQASVTAAAQTHSQLMSLLDDLAPRVPSLSSSSVASRGVPLVSSSPPTVLPFPTAFRSLIQLFTALDSTLTLMLRRATSNAISWEGGGLRSALERVMSKQVTLAKVQELIALYPGSYTLHEAHTMDKDDRARSCRQDYSIGFGSSTGRDEEIETKLTLAAHDGGMPNLAQSTQAMTSAQLTARRAQLEERMKQYVYEAHQAFLLKLQARGLSGNVASSSAASSSSGPQPVLTPADLASIATLLSTPLSRLPCWHPLFSLDHDLPSLTLTPLPSRYLQELKLKESSKPISLKQMVMQKQNVKVTVALEGENRGQRTSTNNGTAVSTSAAAASAAVPAISTFSRAPSSTPSLASTSAASTISAPTLLHKSLSVLSSDVRARLSQQIHSAQVSNLIADGDPQAREELRRLHKLRPLYESIKLRLKQENRVNMPIPELCQKLRSGSDFGDATSLRASLNQLAQLLPHWMNIGSSGIPPIEVIRTQKRGEIDPQTGRDRNHPIIQAAIKEAEKKLRPIEEQQDDDMKTVRLDQPDVQVKVEPVDADVGTAAAARSSSAVPAAAGSSASANPSVKVEPGVKHEHAIQTATARAAAIHATTTARLAAHTPSPIRQSNVSSRASLLAAMGSPARRQLPFSRT